MGNIIGFYKSDLQNQSKHEYYFQYLMSENPSVTKLKISKNQVVCNNHPQPLSNSQGTLPEQNT